MKLPVIGRRDNRDISILDPARRISNIGISRVVAVELLAVV